MAIRNQTPHDWTDADLDKMAATVAELVLEFNSLERRLDDLADFDQSGTVDEADVFVRDALTKLIREKLGGNSKPKPEGA